MLEAGPREFGAQERVRLSQAPDWEDDQLTARSVVVRAYVVNGGDSFAVLPGGLTRVSKRPDDLVVTMQSGGGSKDTWVLANGTASQVVGQASRLAAGASRPQSPGGEPAQIAGQAAAPLPGQPPPGAPRRAADHLFWLGRYTQRLEQLLREVRCV